MNDGGCFQRDRLLMLSIHKKRARDDFAFFWSFFFRAGVLYAAYALLVRRMWLPLYFDHGQGLCVGVEELPFLQSDLGHPLQPGGITHDHPSRR